MYIYFIFELFLTTVSVHGKVDLKSCYQQYVAHLMKMNQTEQLINVEMCLTFIVLSDLTIVTASLLFVQMDNQEKDCCYKLGNLPLCWFAL